MNHNFDKLVMRTSKLVSDAFTLDSKGDNWYIFRFLSKELERWNIEFEYQDKEELIDELTVIILKDRYILSRTQVRLDYEPKCIARLINNFIYMDSPQEVGWLHHDGEMSINEVVLKLMQFQKDGATHINFSPKYRNLNSFDILKKY